MDRERPLRHCNYLCLLIIYAAGVMLVSASSKNSREEYSTDWDRARSLKELNAEKYVKRDTVLEANVSEYGHRFGFVPYHASHAIDDNERFTLRIEFNVSGYVWDRVFVEVIEINKSSSGVPFSAFRYNNMIDLPDYERVLDIPVLKNYTMEWLRVPNAQVEFVFKVRFSMLSRVGHVILKRPVLILSRTSPPRCSQNTCCLSSSLHEISENNYVYHNLIMPRVVRNQQCIECSRTSVLPGPTMDKFNLVIHGKIGVEDVPVPAQIGRCRATSWSSLPTTFVSGTGDNEHAVIRDIPYFNAESCECVEADIPEDYESVQATIDERAIRKTTIEARSKATTQTP